MSKPHLEEQTGQAKQWDELSRQHARVPEIPHTFKMLRMASMSGGWGEAVGLLGVVGREDDREMSDVITGLVKSGFVKEDCILNGAEVIGQFD